MDLEKFERAGQIQAEIKKLKDKRDKWVYTQLKTMPGGEGTVRVWNSASVAVDVTIEQYHLEAIKKLHVDQYQKSIDEYEAEFFKL